MQSRGHRQAGTVGRTARNLPTLPGTSTIHRLIQGQDRVLIFGYIVGVGYTQNTRSEPTSLGAGGTGHSYVGHVIGTTNCLLIEHSHPSGLLYSHDSKDYKTAGRVRPLISLQKPRSKTVRAYVLEESRASQT